MPPLNTRRLPALVATAVAIFAVGLGLWWAANHDWHRRTIQVGGANRTYLWYPPSGSTTELRPLVLAYHGFKGPAERLRRSSHLHELAAEQGFYLAYIQGNPTWQVFDRGGEVTNPDTEMFDVLTADLIARYPIDPRRVYVVGMSRGGNFVTYLGMRRSEKIAALVAQGACHLEQHTAERPLPMMFIVGTKDGEVTLETILAVPDAYRQRGHEVQVLRPQDVPHRWEVPLNDELWQFLSAHRLPEP